MKYAHKNPALSVIHTIISVKLSTFCSISRYQSLLKCTFLLDFQIVQIVSWAYQIFYFPLSSSSNTSLTYESWLLPAKQVCEGKCCCLILIKVCWAEGGRWCEYKCVVMTLDTGGLVVGCSVPSSGRAVKLKLSIKLKLLWIFFLKLQIFVHIVTLLHDYDIQWQ